MPQPVIHLFRADALDVNAKWEPPVTIVSDGAYGIGGFEGDPPSHEGLADWYRPHVAAWGESATPRTTLWFWNTEVGWATVHPLLVAAGWEYRCCHIWNKGIGHIAGNANSLTLRKYPVVSEVCVQYVNRAAFDTPAGVLDMKQWLRHEWRRSGLPLYETNRACGVWNAATRKYLTQDHPWYYPPVEMFERLVEYANRHGRPEGRPYFSVDGREPLTGAAWGQLRAHFKCDVGVTNVWDLPAVRGEERLKDHCGKCVHLNQKPLALMRQIVSASTLPGDVVWEPFRRPVQRRGGLPAARPVVLQRGDRPALLLTRFETPGGCRWARPLCLDHLNGLSTRRSKPLHRTRRSLDSLRSLGMTSYQNASRSNFRSTDAAGDAQRPGHTRS